MEEKYSPNKDCFYDELYSLEIAKLLDIAKDAMVSNIPNNLFKKSLIIPRKVFKSSFGEATIPEICFDFLFYSTNFNDKTKDEANVLPVIEKFYALYNDDKENIDERSRLVKLEDTYFEIYFQKFRQEVEDFFGDFSSKDKFDHIKSFLTYFILDNQERIAYLLPNQN